MAKKADLIEEATKLGIEVSEKNTIAQIQELIDKKSTKNATEDKSAIKKSGKHSAKGIKESEEKQSKIEKQQQKSDETALAEPAITKIAVKPARSKLERRGKKYQKVAKLIDNSKVYSLDEALELVGKTNPSKFNASVELHIKLGVDPRQADQNIRGTVSLPAGTGKNVRVAVFADIDDAKKALAAGADIAGADEFLQQLDKEQFDFDVLISTPLLMAKLGKYARLLGPKGLMPNPKSGTVTRDVVTAVKEAKAGKVEYRVDSTGIVHLSIGKTDFSVDDIKSNANAIIAAIKAAKPSTIKATYIQSAYLSTTMGPSIKLSTINL